MNQCLQLPFLQTLEFEYEVAEGDLTEDLAYSDRHALVYGFNATYGSSGYESKLRSLIAQASTNPTVAVDRVSRKRVGVGAENRNVPQHWSRSKQSPLRSTRQPSPIETLRII